MKKLVLLYLLILQLYGFSQNFIDGILMPKQVYCGGLAYSHDSWDEYWEGDLKRKNGNIGTLSTRSISLAGAYGITDRINALFMLPYVWTKTSQGTLREMSGVQDLSLGIKYKVLRLLVGPGHINTFLVGSASFPVGNYSPDFLPLSIGLSSKNMSVRLIAGYSLNNGIFVNGSAAFIGRSNIQIDRQAYYSYDRLYLSNEVDLPNVTHFTGKLGFRKENCLHIESFYEHQETLEGDDIRRQDMPFATNKMDFSKIGLFVQYFPQIVKGLSIGVSGAYVLDGRNVGQSTTVTGMLLYFFNTKKAINLNSAN